MKWFFSKTLTSPLSAVRKRLYFPSGDQHTRLMGAAASKLHTRFPLWVPTRPVPAKQNGWFHSLELYGIIKEYKNDIFANHLGMQYRSALHHLTI